MPGCWPRRRSEAAEAGVSAVVAAFVAARVPVAPAVVDTAVLDCYFDYESSLIFGTSFPTLRCHFYCLLHLENEAAEAVDLFRLPR